VAVAEHTHRCGVVVQRQRAVLEREQPDEDRFAGAVGADDGGVLARVDGERDAVEHAAVVLDHRRIDELQHRVAVRHEKGERRV